MRVLGLPLVSLFLSCAVARDFDFEGCNNTSDEEKQKSCAQPIDSVIAVTPGVSYFTKIACKDCPYAETYRENPNVDTSGSRIAHGDQELVSNFPGNQHGGAFLCCGDTLLTISDC
jgi:predicted nucleic-acid-binding Zn-ribbon protein